MKIVNYYNHQLGRGKRMKKKILKEIQEKTQLTYLEKKGALTGSYRGYNISMGTIDKTHDISYIIIPLKVSEDFEIEKMNIFLSELLSRYKGVSVARYEDFRILLNYYPRFGKRNKSEIIMAIIDEILNFAQINNFEGSCCEICGENYETIPVLIEGVIISSCVNCKLEVKNSISLNQQAQRERKNNIVGGIVGGLIGALIGSVIWIIIAQLGYLSAIGGLAIAICNIKGYELFGGKLNLTGIIITSVITLLAVYGAQHISLGFEIYNNFKGSYDITIFDAIKSVPEFLTEKDVSGPFWKNLGIGYLLTIAGSVSYIHSIYKQSNYKIDVEDINL